MKSFQEFKQNYLEEKISSKLIEDNLIEEFNKELDKKNKSDAGKPHLVYKRAVKTILDEITQGSNVKTQVSAQKKKAPKQEGAFRVKVNKETGKLAKIELDLNIPESVINSPVKGKEYLKQLATHELVHAQQFANSDFKSVDPQKAFSPQNFKEYLTLKEEIEAWAVNAAQELGDFLRNTNEGRFAPDNKLFQSLTDNIGDKKKLDQMAKASKSFGSYRRHFARSDDPEDQKVWRRFVKKVVQHIEDRSF